MERAYREERTHGTSVFHLQVYSHHDKDGFYFVSQHWHDELEWIYAEYGVLHLTVHGKAFTLNPGEFCFINSGELHEIRSTGESLHHALVFNPHFLDFALYDACQHNFIHPVTKGRLLFPTLCSAFSPENQKQVLFHMQEIIRLYHSLPSCALLSIKLHILHMIEFMFQQDCFLENTLSPKGKDTLDKLKQVIEYIHENLAQPISLKSLAEICFMSPNYFCHYFKQEIGKTPIMFINESRIEKACEMLSGSDLPISDISLSVEFDNFSYFIRKFREYKGVTPKKYRLLCR